MMILLLESSILMRGAVGVPTVEIMIFTMRLHLVVTIAAIGRTILVLLWLSGLAVFVPLLSFVLPSFLRLLLASRVGIFLESVLLPLLEIPGLVLHHLPVLSIGPSVIKVVAVWGSMVIGSSLWRRLVLGVSTTFMILSTATTTLLFSLLIVAFLLLLLLLSLLLVSLLFALTVELVLLTHAVIASLALGHLFIDGCDEGGYFVAHFQRFLLSSTSWMLMLALMVVSFLGLNSFELLEVFVDFLQVFVVACLSEIHRSNLDQLGFLLGPFLFSFHLNLHFKGQ